MTTDYQVNPISFSTDIELRCSSTAISGTAFVSLNGKRRSAHFGVARLIVIDAAIDRSTVSFDVLDGSC